MKITLAAALAAAAFATAAHAQEDSTDYYAQTTDNKPQLTIGGGMAVTPEYSGADTYETSVIPLVYARKEITPGNTIYLKGLQAGLDHKLNDKLTVGAVGNYRFDRDASDSPRLAGMGDIDAAVELGPKVRYQIAPNFGVEATALFDVSDVSSGYTTRLGGDFAIPLSEVAVVTIGGGVNYGSKKFNNTYYGVKSSEAIAGRPAYQPGSGLTNFDASVSLKQALTNHWSITGRVGADYLLADVADSPLVDQEFQPSASLGVAYTF